MHINKKIIFGTIVGVVVVVVGAYLIIPMPVSDGYTAVFTVTNQFFVGRAYQAPLSRFVELRDPFLLQNVADADTNLLVPQLLDLSVESYWLPKTIFINIDSIVTKGEVNPESPIATKLREYKGAAAE